MHCEIRWKYYKVCRSGWATSNVSQNKCSSLIFGSYHCLSFLWFALKHFVCFFFYFLFFLFNFGIGFASVSLLNAEKFATFFLLLPFVSVALIRKIYVKCFHSSRYVDFKLCCLITFALPLWTFLLECEFCFIPSFEVFPFRFLLLFMVRAHLRAKNWKIRKCHGNCHRQGHRRHSPLMVSID